MDHSIDNDNSLGDGNIVIQKFSSVYYSMITVLIMIILLAMEIFSRIPFKNFMNKTVIIHFKTLTKVPLRISLITVMVKMSLLRKVTYMWVVS